MLSRKVLLALALLPALLAPLHAGATPSYAITELPATFMPTDINNLGQIVGSVRVESGQNHAALFSGGAVTDLGTVGGGSYSAARGINESGLITGISETADGNLHAFLYNSKGIMTDIGAGFAGETNAFAINEKGQVVGQTYVDGGYRGFLYSKGSFTVLPALETGNVAIAWDINDKGSIVGESALTDEFHTPFHPFQYRNGVVTDLGVLADDREVSAARAINNAGRIVGYSEVEDGSLHAFVYEKGVMTDLGSFGGLWLDIGGINERGTFVGDARDNEGDSLGFIYLDGKLVDLNTLIDPTLGWHIDAAYGINDSGQIIAQACREFECSAVRLDLVSAVPEPAMALMLAPGMLLMARTRRRRQRSQRRQRSRHIAA